MKTHHAYFTEHKEDVYLWKFFPNQQGPDTFFYTFWKGRWEAAYQASFHLHAIPLIPLILYSSQDSNFPRVVSSFSLPMEISLPGLL